MKHNLLIYCKARYNCGSTVIHTDMNRIYAIFIVLYCWQKTHSKEYTSIQQYHAPESLHSLQYLNDNQSTPHLTLSYQQILRKLLLPYHQQLPYCYHLPSPYYQNASLQEETSVSPKYLLFYYNTFYHHIASYHLQPVPYLNTPQSFNTSHDEKPSSGFLLFYYNTFYHQNPQKYNNRADRISSAFGHSGNGIQNHISMWKTTPLPHKQDGWCYSKMLAVTPKCKAAKQYKTIYQEAQNFFLSNNVFNTCIYSVTEREKTPASNLLDKLLKAVKNGTGQKFFQKQMFPAYNEKRLYISSNGKVNGFLKILNLQRENSKTKECKNGFKYGGQVLRKSDLSTEDWQNLYDKRHLDKNTFSFISTPPRQQQTTDHVRTSKCPDIYKLWNNTFNNESISFALSGHEIAGTFIHNQVKVFKIT